MVPPLVTASRWAPGPAGERAGDAVPDDARSQLGELVARVAAARAGRASRRSAERGSWANGAVRRTRSKRSSTGQPSIAVAATTCWASTSSGLVGTLQRLDGAAAHPLDGDRGLREVAAVLGEQHPAADLADLVAGAADPLQGAGDARRRLDLDDQVDRAHVDAELEAAGRDHAGQPAALEVVLDERALLLGDRAVVGLGDHRPRRPRLDPDWAMIWAGLVCRLGRSPRRPARRRSR